MREAGRITKEVLEMLGAQVRAGVTTRSLDELAEKFIRAQGAEPAFKGYMGFPATICASVNEEVVHGIPGPRQLATGDIVGIDVGVRFKGYYADAARTFAVGTISEEDQLLMRVTQEALAQGILNAVEGKRLSDISFAVQSTVERENFSVVREFVGHGIGKALHEEPQIPNFGDPGKGPKLLQGMTLAIEPMVNIGAFEVQILPNGWTAVTKDRKRSCHFEETVIVGKDKAEVITA